MTVASPTTLYDKVFNDHVIDTMEDGTCLIYIDRHLVHEVTSPQAFEGLRNANRSVRRPDLTLSTVDHNIPTSSRKEFKNVSSFVKQPDSKVQCETLEDNIKAFGLTYFGLGDKRQGIVHVIGPEQGFTLPGTTVVCGDSHTSTHGAFGALAFGIGTSEVEHVLATQTLLQKKSKNLRISVNGTLPVGVQSKDVILHIIGVIGTAGGTGHVIEFAGPVIESLSIDARMSICNMSIEAGARAGMIAPDQITFDYLKGRPLAPKGADWEKAEKYWKSLRSDPGAKYDKEVVINGSDIIPTVTWGTTPQDVVQITGKVPDPASYSDLAQRAGVERSLEYMGLTPNTPINEISIDKVFIGSCTNSRIEDLRSVAQVVKGRKVASHVYAMIVPGSGLIKKQAEDEGLASIFTEAGFDWREAGCSMCLGMNEDQLKPYERCASTSNRNFEGRQGFKGRTHLMSPAMAAAAAIKGKLADVREFIPVESALVLQFETKDSKSYIFPFAQTDYPTAGVAAESDDGPQAGMPPFTVLKGTAAPMPMTNIDTDKIIPKQFLKTIKRTGLGTALFYELRYHADGTPDPEFVLNKPQYQKSSILIAGANFGCGSSREHAPWALNDFGIRCIIAPSFADIFENNTTKNGMLPITLPQQTVDILCKDAEQGLELEVDLPNQVIRRSDGDEISFKIESFRKHCLVNGLDDIGLTMQKKKLIASFESHRSANYPWLDGQKYQKVPIAVGGGSNTDW
ncbi:3-isopropylmalate dehydratase [Boothiomyces macroporosus]|uniref:3-isopropylmalate dehydratase n=1 Tax=Boothiomyces macroporosus TaxID=261099 RepID=A0AAD5UGJ3_9FUNG|nr:3-isopropylmalate dehydratase [Boothiomyces macroporosus]